MEKGTHRKEHLPQKICVRCGKLFAWRKKWANVWEDVKRCSRGGKNEATSA